MNIASKKVLLKSLSILNQESKNIEMQFWMEFSGLQNIFIMNKKLLNCDDKK